MLITREILETSSKPHMLFLALDKASFKESLAALDTTPGKSKLAINILKDAGIDDLNQLSVKIKNLNPTPSLGTFLYCFNEAVTAKKLSLNLITNNNDSYLDDLLDISQDALNAFSQYFNYSKENASLIAERLVTKFDERQIAFVKTKLNLSMRRGRLHPISEAINQNSTQTVLTPFEIEPLMERSRCAFFKPTNYRRLEQARGEAQERFFMNEETSQSKAKCCCTIM